ncbi:MAG: isoaspartyl peptidase/L-asparaginase family protein [Verrucomicrobiota bacterium]|nr:isoaspartyl peptidase/L-asparaginase family protein [Verrucomicrobiota bacterium]
MAWAIIVHGGAHTISEDKIDPHKIGCARAVDAAAKLLADRGTCLDAVEAAIRILEDDPIFNAGFGSMLNSLGEVEMDAAIMEGSELHAGAVASIRGVRHPISVARQVMDTPHALLSGEGARNFAKERSCELCAPEEMIHEAMRAEWEASKNMRGSDTVGAVALDIFGNFAAGTSTGGLMHKMPGRIGDSPLIGLGLYADNMAGACSLTGDGESIMRLALAHRIVSAMCDGEDADRAAEEAIAVMARRVGGEAGCIVLDRQGRIGLAHNADNLAHAYRTWEMRETVADVKKIR